MPSVRELAAELEKSCSVQTRVVAVDLAEPDATQRIEAAVDGLEISILVNNAGVGAAGRFDLHDGDKLARLVDLNCRAPIRLTAAFLPPMRARRRGAVIFTGSVAGAQPLPLHATYSATKAFDNFLAEALYVECRDSGVDVLSLQPGPLETEFMEVAGELPRAGQAPAAVVQAALEALGRQPAVVTGWLNWIRALLAQRAGSRLLVSYIGRDVMAGQTPGDMR